MSNEEEKRDLIFMGKTQSQIDNMPKTVEEIIKTNLQALQVCKLSSFADMPDWNNTGKVTSKPLKGKKLEGSHQLTIKDRDSWRVVYIAEHEALIVVLHTFKKKTEKKSKKDMDLVTQRLAKLKADIASGLIE